MGTAKKIIVVVGVIVLIFGVIGVLGSISKLNKDLDTIDKKTQHCNNWKDTLNKRESIIEGMTDRDIAMLLVPQYNHDLAEYNKMCL